MRTLTILLSTLLFMASCSSRAIDAENSIKIKADRANVILALNGTIEGNPTHNKTTGWSNSEKENHTVYGFINQDDKITWYLDVAEEGNYNLGFQFTGNIFKLSNEGDTIGRCAVKFDINDRPIVSQLKPLTLVGEPQKMAGTRQWLEEEVSLKKGINRVVFSFDELSGDQQIHATEELKNGVLKKGSTSFGLSDLMVVKSSTLRELKAEAAEMKPDLSWMIDGKYGLFIHWSTLNYPLYGDQMAKHNFEWGVDLFDVDEFASKVEETGASWIIFTVNHGLQAFPAPIENLEAILAGRTTKRDLIDELADALNQRGVKLLLYYNLCPRDEVAKILNINGDPEGWFQFQIDHVKELSLRYGKKIAGWGYIDSSVAPYLANLDYPQFYKALKAGNPDAVVGISSHWYAEYSPFNDITTGDAGGILYGYINKSSFEKGGRYEGMHGHSAFVLDGSWIPREPYNGVIRSNSESKGGPNFSDEEYIEFFKKMDEADIPITTNIMITQDVVKGQPFFNPKSIELMKKIKKALKE